jgi:hypothetical protein
MAFTDKDLPPNGARHNRALYITVECLKAKVYQVLVDIGSLLNVCPLRTATTLGIKRDQLSPSILTIRAYDNRSKSVMGTFKMPYKIGLVKATVVFHVLNIPTSYNLLLGRAWMHPLGIVSSFHYSSKTQTTLGGQSSHKDLSNILHKKGFVE